VVPVFGTPQASSLLALRKVSYSVLASGMLFS